MHNATDASTRTAIYVPVYWKTNDPGNKKGELAVYDGDTVGDVRARIAAVRDAPSTQSSFRVILAVGRRD